MAATKARSNNKASRQRGESKTTRKPRNKKTAGAADADVKVRPQDALEKIWDASSREVAEKSDAIVESLADKAVKGDSTCARMLVELVKQNARAKSKPGLEGSVFVQLPVLEWETDREWQETDKPVSEVVPSNH